MSARSVIVTGSSGAIGRATVADLRDHGHTLIGIDREGPPTGDLAPDVFIEADLGEAGQIEALASRAERLWGVVHAAGVYPIRRLGDYSAELWRDVQAVNLEAAFRLVQVLRPAIVPGGRVVMVASGAGQAGSRDPGYAASKAGLLGLTRSLAIELAEDEVRVNAIAPGLIDTPMSERMDHERRQAHISQSLLRRAGRPEEVAVGIRFLLDPANSYMTGATLDLNGGLHLR